MQYTTTKNGNLMLTLTSPINLEHSQSAKCERLADSAVSTMELMFNNGVPACIEWDVEALGITESIGLWFEGKTLVDYDGVFELPKAAIKLIRKAGYTVPKDFEE